MTEVLSKNIDPGKLRRLMDINPDTKQYFYAKADERWLEYLWKNGFLETLKKKAEDPSQYSYRTPELAYLEKVAPKVPKEVSDIILDVPISAATYNPEVIARFSQIGSMLPAEHLKRIVPKIRDERWIPLIGPFHPFGFEYEKMFMTLSEAKDFDSVLTLAEAVLALRTKEEMAHDARGYVHENPFYFSEMEYTKVFEYCTVIGSSHQEQALAFTLGLLQSIIITDKSPDEKVFSPSETFHLYDVDFFTLALDGRKQGSYREEVQLLAAVVRILAERVVRSTSADAVQLRELYARYFAPLPDSRSFWGLRLYIWSLYPAVFKDELKAALFRIFATDRYHELTGVEYEKALRVSFPVLDDQDKRDYVRHILSYFGRKVTDLKEQEWWKRDGLKLLSCIATQLTPDEQAECVKTFGQKPNEQYKPRQPERQMYAGTVRPRGPVTLAKFAQQSIVDLAAKLQQEWQPEKLQEQNTAEDFQHPLNAEGVGALLKEDLVQRLQEYITHAALFFERSTLDPHYTYAFFRGIEEILREKKFVTKKIDWTSVLNLCSAISASGEKNPFDAEERRERDIYGGWLANWTGVHDAMADMLLQLVTEEDGQITQRFTVYRDQILGVIRYLLTHPDPSIEDEQLDTAKAKVKVPGGEYELGDPYTAAINSVRGRAFQVLTTFLYLDGQKYPKDTAVKIADDVKRVYEETLRHEDTQALMFMFGHHLASFYYRDIAWIRGLLPLLFPTEPEKHDLYLAAWEGFLSASLYEEMFFDPLIAPLYSRAMNEQPARYTKRRYVKELDEGLGVHLALAFTHYNAFGFDSALFKTFWASGNSGRLGGFISFIGRSFVSGDDRRSDEFLQKNPTSKKKLHEFWDWALEHCADAEALKEFGFWMNAGKGIFDLAWQAERIKQTLEKTGGVIEWDFGLMRSIITFAQHAPAETLEILRLLLLEGGVRSKRMHRPFYMENEAYAAFQMLYKNGDDAFKLRVYALIDDLIREGSNAFWKLKDILKPQD